MTGADLKRLFEIYRFNVSADLEGGLWAVLGTSVGGYSGYGKTITSAITDYLRKNNLPPSPQAAEIYMKENYGTP